MNSGNHTIINNWFLIFYANCSGGLELVFDNKKQIYVELADQTEILLETLIHHLEKNYLNDKKEMFI